MVTTQAIIRQVHLGERKPDLVLSFSLTIKKGPKKAPNYLDNLIND